MPTKELRLERYESGTEVQKYLYADANSGLAMLAIAKKHNVDQESLYKKFALIVGDIILGFYEVKETSSLLQNELSLTQSAAELLSADVTDFLSPLTDPNWSTAEKVISPEPDVTPAPEIKTISSEIAEVEADLEAIPPKPPVHSIRTMAGDSHGVGYHSTEEVTHQSDQSNLLQK